MALATEPVIGTASTAPSGSKLALFVTNFQSAVPVTAYPLGSSGNIAPLSSVPDSSITGLIKPYGVARDSKGYLYVTNEWGHSVTIYAPGANGKAAPIATIEDGVDPTGIALDARGNIYVADWQGNSIAVYAAVETATGVDVPAGSLPVTRLAFRVGVINGKFWQAATIQGSATGLNFPRAVALDSAGNIYVANSEKLVGGLYSVTVYRAGSDGDAKPSATISGSHTGLVVPWGIALDSHGNIYVANLGSDDGKIGPRITLYPPGSNGDVAPKATISGPRTGLNSPGGIAVDSAGNIYVTNDVSYSGGHDTIAVYARGSHGDAAPKAILPALGLAQPWGIAVDSNRNIYVANDGSSFGSFDSVLIYPPNSLVPKASIGAEPALDQPAGITIDASGKIFAANGGGGGELGSINIYAPGSYAGVAPSAAIIGTKTGLAQPVGIANSKGKLYVANSAGGTNGKGSVTIYPTSGRGNIAPIATIYDEMGLNSPSGIALDSGGNLYVANTKGGLGGDGSITIYRAGTTGNVTATATISDNPGCAPCDKTKLSAPVGLALDSSGNIYVVNSSGDTEVTVYPPLGSSTGILNEAPTAAIHGTIVHNDKGIYIPSGITLDSTGNIYVTYGGWSRYGGPPNSWGSIAVYPAGSSGNVKPIAIIEGDKTWLSSPQGIAIGPAGQ